MPDLPPIHPGSSWQDGEILDEDGHTVAVDVEEPGESILAFRDPAFCDRYLWVSDVLAVLRLAGLVPEVEALRKARERIAELEAKLSALRPPSLLEVIDSHD